MHVMLGRSLLGVALLGGWLTGATARAQAPAGPPGPGLPMGTAPSDNARLSATDILGKLRSSDQLAIRAGAIAQAKAQARPVRELADKLVRDRTALDQKVSSFAVKNDINLGEIPMQTDTSVLDRLRSAQGAEFDREFLAFAVGEHDKDLTAVRQMREQTDDPRLKGLLEGALPVLDQHRTAALKLQQQLGGSNATPQPRPESQGGQPGAPADTGRDQGGGY